MNLLTGKEHNENEMATRNAAAAEAGGPGSGRKPAHLEPDGERIDPGHTLNALHDDVFSPPDDDDDDKDDEGDDKKKTAELSPGLESPWKKPKSKQYRPHLHLPRVYLHVPYFKTDKKHEDTNVSGGGSDLLGTAEHHRDTSSTKRIEESLSKESSASAKMELFGGGALLATEDDVDRGGDVAKKSSDRDLSEISTSQISSHSAQQDGIRPPPPSAEPSSSSLRSSISTNSTGVTPSHPHEHGIHSLLHSPILTRSTKVIGKLAHTSPHLPHIPELPHMNFLPSRGQSVEASLAALDLEDTSIASILEHMGKHPDHTKVQERGCARLVRLAKERDNMQEITDTGGIEIILEAARNHNDDTELLTQSFSALGNIVALNSENKQKVAHLQGIETILSAMLAHSYDPVLQERACGLLFNLSFDHQNKELIAENHGIEAIIEAMKHFPAYPNLQHNAICALWNLGGSVANKERIASANGVHTIIQSMDKNRDHTHIQRSALGALRTLSLHHGAKNHIAQHGGVASTLHAMRHHHEDRHVQKEGCGLMRNLLTHHDHRETLRSHRPERELEHAADNFPIECEDNAWSCLERLEAVSERNASTRTNSS